MIPHEIEIDELVVEIYVVGPGFGEGICIIVGEKIFIGIDCCASLVHARKDDGSFLDSLCDRIGPEGIYLWVITHFHYDHIHCLSLVLEKLSGVLHCVLAPSDYTEADLALDVGLDAEDVKNNAAAFYLGKNEFQRIRALLLRNPGIVKGGFGLLPIISIKLICGERKKHLSIEAFGPTIAESALLVGGAIRSLAEREGLVSKARDAANSGSYVLRLLIDDFEGLFLGDALAKRVEELFASGWRMAGRPSFLKVAHHGSKDGTSEALLRLMTGGRESCRAVIAPFTRHKLPDENVIGLLRQFGFQIETCGATVVDATSHSEIREDYLGVAEVSLANVSPFGSGIVESRFDLDS